MSDVPQGPGWWQASDDKWYPPPRPEMPGEEQAPTTPVTATPSGDYPPQAPQAPPMQAPPMSPYGPPVQGPPTVQGPPMGAPSPYGGVPPVAPPPGAGQNRTPLFVAIGVLGALVFVGLIVILTSDDDDGDETSGSTTTAVTATTGDPAEPPDTATPETVAPPSGEGAVREVEQGFTVARDELSETEYGTYGVVLENTTDQVATSVEISVGFVDESGTVIGTDEQILNVLGPGQTFGIGNSGIELDGTPVELDVTVGEPMWESAGDHGQVTASGVSTTVDDYGAPTTNFTAESTYGEQLDSPYAFAIYRNADGEIVGGNWDIMSFIQADGSTTGDVTSLYTIEDIDESQTEVYVDPGFIT